MVKFGNMCRLRVSAQKLLRMQAHIVFELKNVNFKKCTECFSCKLVPFIKSSTAPANSVGMYIFLILSNTVGNLNFDL
jgi:hypothetical protein